MSYGQFASIYDQFMYDQPYDKWLAVIQPYLKNNLLDLATGTGSFIELLPKTIKVTGVDLSEDMLTIAALKRNDVTFIAQDMTNLELNQTYQTITCLCDSLNYLAESDDVIATFNRVYDHLDDDGVFIFDVHSTAKFDAYFTNQTYSDEQEGMLYVWHAVQGEVPYSVYHDLTFFTEDNGVYHRFDEQHYQRTFEISDYLTMLKQARFKTITIFADFDPNFVIDTKKDEYFERVFFVVKKK
ncbi:class I SAM-dependent DNA methyltransferase [Macrococcus animalis]|uniref:class I SAM-dependent DNA methyltransferase n=1 Tax=Macrococcus animalis TaxID=3395467 RepID=UPI0039BDF4B4